MSKFIFLLLVLSSLAWASATFSSLTSSSDESPTQVSESFAVRLSQWLVDTISRKMIAIARFFNLKIRLVRFMVSLFTTENLVLLRHVLEEALALGNFSLRLLPESVDDPIYWWVPALSHFINLSVGDTGLFGLALSPFTVNNSTEETTSEVSEIITTPSVFFNVPLSSTEQSTTDSNDIDTRNKRLTMEQRADDEEVAETEETPITKADILKKYEENLITLDKLINAGRND